MVTGGELVLTVPRSLEALALKVPALCVPNAKAAERFFEFFTANIRNKNTRRAYYKAVCRFSAWCESRGLHDLAAVKPLHVRISKAWRSPNRRSNNTSPPSACCSIGWWSGMCST